MGFGWETIHNDDGYLVTRLDDTILHANHLAQQYLGLSPENIPQPARFLDMARRSYRCEPEAAWDKWPAVPKRSKEALYLIRPETPETPPSWLQVEVSPQLPTTPHQRLIRLHDVSDSISASCKAWTLRNMITHKFRAPLATLMTCLDMMNLDRNLLPPDIGELIDLSRLSLNRLHQDVIQIARADEQLFSAAGSSFKLSELPDLLDRLGTALQLRRITVAGAKMKANLSLTPSSMTVETIMVELLKNAHKYHPEHNPSVTVIVTRLNDELLSIQVMDNGCYLHGKECLVPRLHAAEHPAVHSHASGGQGLPMVAALVWECGGSFRLYNRDDIPGVVAELVFPIIR